jgi:C4-dicarboxylate-specific signal transduction histidine kinase
MAAPLLIILFLTLLDALLLFGHARCRRAHRRDKEELRKARADLAHLSRVTALGELAASIAHEVNQPLAAITTYGDACLRLLSATPPNLEKARDAVGRIIGDSMRASEVIKRIRALVKKDGPEKSPLDVNEIVREVIGLTHRELHNSRVALRLELARDLPRVLGDRVELQQVLLNLMLNSVEALSAVTGRARELRIYSRADGPDRVVVSVHDSGVGLALEDTSRIFDPFFTTKPGGLGIGLSISRMIIEAHGGSLRALPNGSRGAVFQLTLPTSQ